MHPCIYYPGVGGVYITLETSCCFVRAVRHTLCTSPSNIQALHVLCLELTRRGPGGLDGGRLGFSYKSPLFSVLIYCSHVGFWGVLFSSLLFIWLFSVHCELPNRFDFAISTPFSVIAAYRI